MRISAQRQDQPHEQVSSRFAQSNAAPFGPNHHSTLLLHLQRTIGNKAVHRMLETSADAHDAQEAHATAVLRRDGRPTLRRQPDPNPRGPQTPPLETIPKKEEGEGNPPTPAEAPCNVSSGGALPCTPKGVSIDEFLKKGPPRNALGVTRYGHQKFPNPEVVTKDIGKGKDKVFVIQKTKAVQISCESFFVKADDKKTISRTSALDPGDPKQSEGAERCHGQYSEDVRVFPDGEKRIAAAELEHCQDYRYAFDISLGCYADVVNDFSKKGTKFPSREAAVDAVTKRVGLEPDAWVQRYIDLLDKSELRDANGWHTAIKSAPLQLDPQAHPCHSSFPNEIGRRSYPEVGKHPSSEIIK